MINRCLAGLASLLCVLSSRAEVIINEIHYDPDIKTELVEFIELYNTASTNVDLSGWAFTDAVGYTFPAGTTITANGYIVVTENPTQFATKFGKTALGPWTGSLNNDGEEIVLRDQNSLAVDKVDYRREFPWPVVGDPPGFSIELANPSFDNDLGGNWRPSGTAPSVSDFTIIPKGSTWKYFKGLSEPSGGTTDWRDLNFTEDANWLTGDMPIGYDPSVPMKTSLPDMAGNYSAVYFRKVFNVADPSAFSTLQIQAMYDDGFKVWINGRLVAYPQMPTTEVPYNATATGSARESSAYDTFTLPVPVDYLVPGQNIIAVQGANILLSGSSDFFIDLTLIGRNGSGGVGPTPGARNNSFTDNLPPAIRQVDNSPNQPTAGQAVVISAKVTDPDGVTSVQLQYQIVDPGNYIDLTDAAYATSWTTVAMNDAGTNGDQFPGDSTYTATLPGSLQTHRRLIRYRIVATDGAGKSITAPYADDPCPNFAYFCYNGVPSWSGSIQPGGAATTYSSTVMNRLPVYHLLSKKASVEASNWIERYAGDLYKWEGALVYDGKVYDHIHYRARGGVWRYAMGKNMWKIDFNHGHDFHPRDNWGREYDVAWTKLNLGACIQQGDYLHRGEQGMYESIGFRLFNLVGVEAPQTHFIHFRVVDDGPEVVDQYNGDFWGLYLAVEQEDSRFLEGHDMPDSNFYKMEGGTGTLNNEGPYGPSDTSDLSSFLGSITVTQPESWWRDNFDVNRYYSYRTVVEGIHHYDIDGNPGKNYFYYTNGVTHKWEVHPWDLDLTWADNMYGGGNEQFKSRVLPIANLSREYKNRVREIRDLLFNTEQAYQLIDEYAAMINTPGQPSFVGADRAMWDYNPIMISSYVNSSKAGQGRFYQAAATKDFPGMVQLMKNYVVSRSSLLDSQSTDAGLPTKPSITNASPVGNPANRLAFQSSDYAGSSAFAAMQWRLGEITPAGAPAYDPKKPRV
ncbi:MAG TPA: CotH kinase family protein, partial [Verrucomicrobiae bacterium]